MSVNSSTSTTTNNTTFNNAVPPPPPPPPPPSQQLIQPLTTRKPNFTYNLNTIFTIVVCGQVFNISWKSLLSDGPQNFFTRHFLKSTSRIMHIDRSPNTFKLIIRHLRGYNIQAKDECQQQDLLNDAQYFGLVKLIKELKQFVYLNIGGTTFRVRWDLFDKDGPHNYFTGPLKHKLYSPHLTDGESIPITIERDPETFKDVIRHLQGYAIHIKDEQHRLQLLSDAQFYLFRKLRDKLKSSIIKEDRKEELLLFVQDIRPNQMEFVQPEETAEDTLTTAVGARASEVYYKQDKKLFSLAIQLVHFTICCHKSLEGTSFYMDNTIKLAKDPSWSISNQVEFNTHCAIVIQDPEKEGEEKAYTVQEYLSEQLDTINDWKPCCEHTGCCQMQSFAVEKAIAKVFSSSSSLSSTPTVTAAAAVTAIAEGESATTNNKVLFISFEKLQIIGSRLQANMKRDFLSH